MTRAHKTGVYFAWLIFISAWGSDTFAYFTGKALGKHKLCPNLSPKKTVEGSLGGVIGATAMSVIYALLANKFALNLEVNMVFFCATIGFFGSMFSQFGDLAASAIKRQTGIKDFGYIIPGHGGALDRFDSMLFTAPSVFIVMYVLINYV
jgi:phosphatidate cytidylyltransferase